MILPLLAAAVAFQNTATIDRAVGTFTGHAIGEQGGAIAAVDPRLKLARCEMVAMSWRSDAHDAVVVSCPDPQWRVFVPVRASPRAVAATPLVPAAPVKPVAVIKRGDAVTIEAGSPGFAITREGVAMGDAPVGGRFAVKVDGATAPVQAVALAGGRATLPGWGE